LLTEQLSGYSRIILAISSLYYMPLHPRTCCLLYSISCILDAFDGYAARRLDQSTRFGAVLDMITDRCTTSSLLVFLASAFPRYSIIFQGLISLDFASHFMHVYATLAMGGSSQSHKKIDESRSWVLKQYYSNNVRRFSYFKFEQPADPITESSLYILRHERTLLYCSLSTLFLFSSTFLQTPPTHRFTIHNTIRISSSSKTINSFCKSMVSRSNGDGSVSLVIHFANSLRNVANEILQGK